MKFYIGSGFKNKDMVNYFSDKLCHFGLISTYNWARVDVFEETIEDLILFSNQEKKAIEESDIVIIILPAGRGSHVELGMALSLNKKIYLCAMSPEEFDIKNTVDFYQLPCITRLSGTPDEIIEEILKDCRK